MSSFLYMQALLAHLLHSVRLFKKKKIIIAFRFCLLPLKSVGLAVDVRIANVNEDIKDGDVDKDSLVISPALHSSEESHIARPLPSEDSLQ